MPAGRPCKFQNASQMQLAVDDYFATRDDSNRPTVTGLALALDLTREGLTNYEARDEFYDTVKKAKARVQEFIENRLYDPNATGCIFNLKNNFGWKDQNATDITTGGDKITVGLVRFGDIAPNTPT
jgi:hypothetical protein